MFSNPVYNLPPQFSESALPQNLAGLSLNSAPLHQEHHHHQHQQRQNLDFLSFQQQQQQIPLDIGGYVPPSLDNTLPAGVKWPSPDDVSASYQRGSTVVRQYNNSMIDDYYKKFLRPITDYVAIPTNGQPTYVYQNLGGAAPGATAGAVVGNTAVGGGSFPSDVGISRETKYNPFMSLAEVASAHQGTVPDSSHSKGDGTEEKKHKKKHKKRSSKHSTGEGGSKHSDGEKATEEQ